jgi:hypothetical protein
MEHSLLGQVTCPVMMGRGTEFAVLCRLVDLAKSEEREGSGRSALGGKGELVAVCVK